MNSKTKKITLTAMFAAVAVVGSFISFPVFGAKCAPVQHMVNIISAIVLGPWWALLAAVVASTIRVMTGLGTFMAFPGSMCGALLAGLLYKLGKKIPFALIGELVGTSLIGGMLAFPVAKFLLGNDAAALFTFVVPFLISSAVGTIIAGVVMFAMSKSGALKSVEESLK